MVDTSSVHAQSFCFAETSKGQGVDSPLPAATPGNIQAQNFTFRELATATKNFTPDSLLGEGGFGRVYKGVLDNGAKVIKPHIVFISSVCLPFKC